MDAALARRIAAGDTTAEAELCRRFLPRVRAWGLKHLRDEAAALDLGQHVLLVVLQALRAGKVDDLDRIGAFVVGTCKMTLVAWQRGERRRSALLDQFGPGFADVAEMREVAIDRRRLASCFEHLAPRARTLLVLAFFGDRETAEIASELQLTTANVRVLRHRALQQLHTCMEAA